MIEKILERLEDYKYTHLVERNKERLEHCTENDRAKHCDGIDCFWCVWDKAIEIVQEVAKEYGNGWIPCEVALPKEATTYEVTCEIILCSKKQYITTYALWGTEGEWICRKNERVIAWKEKSAPYQKGEPKKDCNTCANNTDFDEVDNGCYMCCKGLENNYEPIEQKGE